MKPVWTIISTVAVANLLALAGFVGWLRATDRLDMARVQKAREMFAVTLAQQGEQEAAARAQIEAGKKAVEQAVKAGRPVAPAATQIETRSKADEMDRQRVLKLRQVVTA